MDIISIIKSWIERHLLPEKGLFYIGGSDTLPPPLDKADEEKAIIAMENGDECAKKLLTEHNLRLVVYISRRFENTGVNLEDLISIGTIGLIKAINTFRSDKNIKLATYASRCIENEIRHSAGLQQRGGGPGLCRYAHLSGSQRNSGSPGHSCAKVCSD